jgi:hypothetical protein
MPDIYCLDSFFCCLLGMEAEILIITACWK